MKKKLKAVLFDMDGVLFDSMPYHSEAWHKVMKSHGLTLSREEAYMHEDGQEPLQSILFFNVNWVEKPHRRR